MKPLGMDLYHLEAKGLFKYIRLPLAAGNAIKEVISYVIKEVLEFKPEVVVIDSITPILNIIPDRIIAKMLLHNTLYELPKMINGVVILTGEVGHNHSSLPDLAHLADTVIMLDYRYVGNSIFREIVVNKVRGTDISLAKTPFIIADGLGFITLLYPRSKDLPALNRSKVCRMWCEAFTKTIGEHIYSGWNTFITYDADVRPYILIASILLNMLLNKFKTLIISYKLAPDDVLGYINRAIKSVCSKEVDLSKLFEHYLVARGFNLGILSPEELYSFELELIHKIRPDVVFFMDVDMLAYYYGARMFKYLHSQVLYLKKLGIFSFRSGSYINELFYRMNATLSESIIRLIFDKETLMHRVYILSGWATPSVLSYDEINRCVKVLTDMLATTS